MSNKETIQSSKAVSSKETIQSSKDQTGNYMIIFARGTSFAGKIV